MRRRYYQSRLFWLTCAALLGGIMYAGFRGPPQDAEETASPLRPQARRSPVIQGHVVNWWGPIPDEVRLRSVVSTEPSNVLRTDYSGASSCRECHKENYKDWSKHPHRWMNAMANESTVLGDFSGRAEIRYRGGTARFYQGDDEYRMRLERGDVRRVYRVSQTIGSRFYQYYVGTLISGPEPKASRRYTVDHVLPFGYWLEKKEWVPTVHVHWVTIDGSNVDEEDLPSEKRPDPFAAPEDSPPFTEYFRCNQCHTTFPLGDMLVGNGATVGRHLGIPMHVDVPGYLREAHPRIVGQAGSAPWTDEQVRRIRRDVWKMEAPDHAVNLGISCEACHLGSRRHAQGALKKPEFLPRSRYVMLESSKSPDFGRTHHNVNWVCARCHTGNRRQLAGGMATWNSTEFTDAMRGSCYTKLKCVDCHNPHKATGRKWSFSPDHDDKLCLKCHQTLEPTERREAHTHHPAGSSGARCMNCHMPHINEGMQDVVRTHMIYSPTNRAMIEANHPNACNQCHVKESIDWTLKYLARWYGASFSSRSIARNYPDRKASAALAWLNSKDQSVRLIAADSLTRSNATWALPQLIDALDDPYLLNRQFAARGIEKMLGIRLIDYGYRYYQSRDERQKPLRAIRKALTPRAARKPRPVGFIRSRGPPATDTTNPGRPAIRSPTAQCPQNTTTTRRPGGCGGFATSRWRFRRC